MAQQHRQQQQQQYLIVALRTSSVALTVLQTSITGCVIFCVYACVGKSQIIAKISDSLLQNTVETECHYRRLHYNISEPRLTRFPGTFNPLKPKLV
jgi:hypothetical protein